MDLATLKSDLRSILGRDVSGLAIKLAMDELSKELRITEMEEEIQLACASGEILLPAGFISVVVLKNANGGVLSPTSHERLASINATGDAARFVVGSGKLTIVPEPADGEVFSLTYFKQLSSLIDNGDTNVALEHALDAASYCTLKHQSKLLRDANAAQFWDGEFQRALTSANRRSLLSRWDGGTLEIDPLVTVV